MIRDNELMCPSCGGCLKYYDKVERIIRSKYRKTRKVWIRRMICASCGSLHRELPDYILPYKQYEAEIVRGVVNELITCETLGFEDYPCELTMIRWIRQKNYLV